MISLDEKMVIITGAARGQGAREAEVCAELGARVVLTDVLDAEGEIVAQRIAEIGAVALYRHLDVRDRAEWADVVGEAAERFGGVDGLVNNAGITLRDSSLVETTREDWNRVLDINLTGPFLGIQAVAPTMIERGGGSIVNIGSTAGLTGHMRTAYGVSKWGLRGLTKSAALELATSNIRVNSVHPGLITTPIVDGVPVVVEAMVWMTPLRRAGSVNDTAPTVAFLLGDASSFITGVDLAVDGGFTEAGLYRKGLDRWMEGR